MKLLEQRRLGGLIFVYGLSQDISRSNPKGFNKYLPGYIFDKLTCSHDEIRFLFDAEELHTSGKKLAEEFFENERYAETLFDFFETTKALAIARFEKEKDGRLNKVTSKELANTLKDMLSYYHQNMTLGAFAEYLDIYLSSELNALLAKLNLPNDKTQEALLFLTTSKEESFSREAEKNLLKIVETIQSKKNQKSKATHDNKTKRMIKEHIDKFYWTSCNYFNFSGLGLDSVNKLIKKELQNKISAKEKLAEMGVKKTKLEKTKQQLFDTLKLDKKLKYYLSLAQRISILFDNRKKTQMHMFYSGGRILKEIAKRNKTDFDLAKYVFPHEITTFAEGKISKQTLQTRRDHTYIDFGKKDPLVLFGEEAKKAEDALWTETGQHITEVNGLCASAGKVIAPARVITSARGLGQLKKGEILVTGITSPEYVPYLGKAVGIITDDGGITCHAAIISRELKIPCIVGTKIATRKIKTGDLIDLRAHHGLARILPPAKA